jgi:hypothetical protein
MCISAGVGGVRWRAHRSALEPISQLSVYVFHALEPMPSRFSAAENEQGRARCSRRHRRPPSRRPAGGVAALGQPDLLPGHPRRLPWCLSPCLIPALIWCTVGGVKTWITSSHRRYLPADRRHARPRRRDALRGVCAAGGVWARGVGGGGGGGWGGAALHRGESRRID